MDDIGDDQGDPASGGRTGRRAEIDAAMSIAIDDLGAVLDGPNFHPSDRGGRHATRRCATSKKISTHHASFNSCVRVPGAPASARAHPGHETVRAESLIGRSIEKIFHRSRRAAV